MGYHAVDYLVKHPEAQTALGIQGGQIVYTGMLEAVSRKKEISEDIYTIAQVLSI